MTLHCRPLPSLALLRIRAAFALGLVVAALGCGPDGTQVPAACTDLLECCSELADAEACERSYDAALELDDHDAAAQGCAAAVSGAQDLGFCGGDGTDADPASASGADASDGTAQCQALRSCCMQMAQPTECLTSAAEYQTDPQGETLCRELREVFIEAGLCIPTEDDDLACSDGIDNDGNGFTDCDDFSCTRAENVTVCEGMVENTDALCSDGIDNDGNGFTDCDDFDCSMNSDVSACTEAPMPGAENTDAACSDGGDNDADGFIDCDDFDCSSPGVTVCNGTSPNAESTNSACVDGLDNDADGFVDCDDYDCSMNPEVTVC
ncbi:MAG: hypothetical protein ACRBN8_07600 [Nannocystales bacterium]